MKSGLRLWRARKRHDHIDAVLRRVGEEWALEFSRNDKPMFERRYLDEESARTDAATRLKDLQRAGWIDHW